MDCFDQSLNIYQRLGLSFYKASTLMDVGRLLAADGNQTAAQTAWRQAWTIFHDLRVPEAIEAQALLQS
jgi:hypothetical protein